MNGSNATVHLTDASQLLPQGEGFFASDEALRKALREPFPKQLIRQRKNKGGGTADYVEHNIVTERLNDVAPGWTFTIDRIKESPDGTHVIGVVGTMTIGGKSIPEVGGPENPSSWEDELKVAVSDFIKRGAMRFGVAIDLWGKTDSHESSGVTPSEAGGGGRATGKGSPTTASTSAKAATKSEGGATSGAQTAPPSDLFGEKPPGLESLWVKASQLYGSRVKVLSAAHKRFGAAIVTADDVTQTHLEALIDVARAEA